MDCEAVFVDGDFDLIGSGEAGVNVTFLSPCNDFIAGLHGEEGEEAAVIVVDEGFEVGGFALLKFGAELVFVPGREVLVIGDAMGGFAFAEIDDASGQAHAFALEIEAIVADGLWLLGGVPT